jgi:uncharacterized protein YndB with AHSA1/START domain
MRRAARLVALAAAVAVLLLLVAWVVGARLPVEHVASVRAEFQQPPEALWERLTDVEDLTSWREGIDEVELLSSQGEPARWREQSGFGTFVFQTVEADPPRRLEIMIAEGDPDFGGSWAYELEPQGEGTRVTVTERGQIYNPLIRLISRYVTGHHATMESDLRLLGRSFEEDVQPQRVEPVPID